MARVSTLDHWESYWKGHQHDIDDTYSTGGRLVREVLADGPVAGKRVMEIGAGSGRDLIELARMGASGIVLDYSPASLGAGAPAGGRAGVPVMLVQADATRMPFRDGAIDISFHQGLLEHFRDPRPLLAENARITRPGGRVLVDVPQTFHLVHRHEEAAHPREPLVRGLGDPVHRAAAGTPRARIRPRGDAQLRRLDGARARLPRAARVAQAGHRACGCRCTPAGRPGGRVPGSVGAAGCARSTGRCTAVM
jgi:SAM-dependent methyltransferase